MKNNILYAGSFDFERSRKPAFDALLEYERNCQAKYDRPGQPSRTPPQGERMEDYARKHGVTIEQMKECRNDVEKFLNIPK